MISDRDAIKKIARAEAGDGLIAVYGMDTPSVNKIKGMLALRDLGFSEEKGLIILTGEET